MPKLPLLLPLRLRLMLPLLLKQRPPPPLPLLKKRELLQKKLLPTKITKPNASVTPSTL